MGGPYRGRPINNFPFFLRNILADGDDHCEEVKVGYRTAPNSLRYSGGRIRLVSSLFVLRAISLPDFPENPSLREC